MKKLSSLKSINRRYHSFIKNLTKGTREKEILESLSNGKNSYLRLDRVESSAFDRSWIEEIEDVIFDLGDIISNPKQVTKTEGSLMPVELAKKVNAESVQHLASHTQYIKEIDDYGNVIPSKLLSLVSDDDIKTYENRFIATFVRRLLLFVEKRYEIVSQFAELHDEEILYFKNKSFVDGATVEIETKIKVSHKSDDELSLKSNAYVERIKQMRQYILYYYNSDFMRKLKTEKDVHNPILQTNIIRKNPKYRHCYEVYRFLERYDSLGVHYKVDENYSLFNDEELKELNRTIFANYITLRGKDRSKNAKVNSKVYKPKILTSMDDESFIYGPYLSGPIEFVRIDQGYQEYLDSKIKKDLPLHPTKKEKEYYADEYAEKAENKQDQKQRNDLIKRVEKGVRDFNKQAKKIDEEREQARLELLRREQELIRQEEDDMLAKARAELIAASINDHQAVQEEKRKEEQELIASIKPAVIPVEMSHPHQDPVTYDEAVKQIWPQINTDGQPLKVEQPVEEEVIEEVVEEQQVEETKPVIVVVPMSHPHEDPVTYDEAVKQIWPQIKDQPAPKKVQKVKKVVVKHAPVKQEQPVQEETKEAPVIVVVPMSHPHEDPVTYDEAVMQIWPQINTDGQPLKVEEVIEEEAVIEPAIIPVPMSHPHEDPVTYDQAVTQIWPQINTDGQPLRVKQPAPKKVAVKKAKPVKKVVKPKPVVKKEPVEEIKPAVIPVEMSHPHQEPVSYEQAVEQIWPQINTDGQPLKVEEKPAAPKAKKVPSKKPVATAKAQKPIRKEKKPEPIPVEPTPIEKPTPIVEPAKPRVKKVPVKKESNKVDLSKPPIVEPIVEEDKSAPVKAAPKKKAPAKKAEAKPAPVKKAAPKKKKPVKKEEPVVPERKKIPGKFIVKTNKGYYVNKNKYSVYKEDAKIFDDFNLANDLKKEKGGKVVKL